jgi:RsiW-degrading membrane proteinase PrsW (M82 family)
VKEQVIGKALYVCSVLAAPFCVWYVYWLGRATHKTPIQTVFGSMLGTCVLSLVWLILLVEILRDIFG